MIVMGKLGIAMDSVGLGTANEPARLQRTERSGGAK